MAHAICLNYQYTWCKKEVAAQKVTFYNNLSENTVLKFEEQPGNLVSRDIVLMGNESGLWLLTLNFMLL